MLFLLLLVLERLAEVALLFTDLLLEALFAAALLRALVEELVLFLALLALAVEFLALRCSMVSISPFSEGASVRPSLLFFPHREWLYAQDGEIYAARIF